MAQRDYSFLDIAVLDEVRTRFAAADAVAILSTDLAEVIWANGPGAALFGHADIESIMGAETGLPFAARRQIMATPGFPEIGSDRPLTVRLASGMTSRTVGFLGSRIALPGGEPAILLAVPFAQGASRTAAEIAERAIGGFGEAGHHVALVDGQGRIEAASQGFDDLGIAPQTLETLAAEAASADDRLVKRLIAAGANEIPAGMARLRDDPPLSLFVAVGTNEAEEEQPAVPTPPPAVGDDIPVVETVEEIPPAFDTVLGGEPEREQETDAAGPAAPAEGPRRREETAEDDRWYFGPGHDRSAEEQPAPVAGQPPAEDRPAAEEPTAGKPAAAKPTSDEAVAMPRADRAAAPVRFVWRTDAEGRFSALSHEFTAAVGDAAADVVGRSFADVAAAFGLDPDGEIAGLLERRDTWSGRSVLWPVADTDLRVPVDLAALPVYGRNRNFEGFRGFGVARTADAVIDPDATGLSLGRTLPTDAAEPVPTAAAEAAQEAPASTAPETAGPGPGPEAAEPVPPVRGDAPRREDPFKGEVPALTLVPKPERRFSDKIIRLAEHRQPANDKGLTPVEKNAFREIGDRLKKEGSAAVGEGAGRPVAGDNDQPQAPGVDRPAAVEPGLPESAPEAAEQGAGEPIAPESRLPGSRLPESRLPEAETSEPPAEPAVAAGLPAAASDDQIVSAADGAEEAQSEPEAVTDAAPAAVPEEAGTLPEQADDVPVAADEAGTTAASGETERPAEPATGEEPAGCKS